LVLPVQLFEHKHPGPGPESCFGSVQPEYQCRSDLRQFLIALFLSR